MTTTAEWRKWNAMQTKPITNADWIRSMTDEELARWLTGFVMGHVKNIDGYELSERYEEDALKWLKEEVTDG